MKKKLTSLLSLILIIEIHSQEGVSKELNQDEVAKELLRQWIQTEKQLSDEEETWKQERRHISDLLGLYEKELKLLSEELKAAESVEIDDEKKEKIQSQIKEDEQVRRKLREFLLVQKPRVLGLVEKFPVPLQDQIAQTVEELKSKEIEESPRDLLMPMLTVIEAGHSFNAGVFRTSQKVTVGAEEWQAEVMYLGLARAYFWVGEKAGIGIPSATGIGWEWKRADEQLKEIKNAMVVFDKLSQPVLIKLPLKVH